MQIEAVLAEALPDGGQVLLTGHSLGGALAQLAAVAIAAASTPQRPLRPLLVTFAAPAIGDMRFAAELRAAAEPCGGLRVYNADDPIPPVTAMFGYRHAGLPIVRAQTRRRARRARPPPSPRAPPTVPTSRLRRPRRPPLRARRPSRWATMRARRTAPSRPRSAALARSLRMSCFTWARPSLPSGRQSPSTRHPRLRPREVGRARARRGRRRRRFRRGSPGRGRCGCGRRASSSTGGDGAKTIARTY